MKNEQAVAITGLWVRSGTKTLRPPMPGGQSELETIEVLVEIDGTWRKVVEETVEAVGGLISRIVEPLGILDAKPIDPKLDRCEYCGCSAPLGFCSRECYVAYKREGRSPVFRPCLHERVTKQVARDTHMTVPPTRLPRETERAVIFAPCVPMTNEEGSLCGTCDSTRAHEHAVLTCTRCWNVGLAENMTDEKHRCPAVELEAFRSIVRNS